MVSNLSEMNTRKYHYGAGASKLRKLECSSWLGGLALVLLVVSDLNAAASSGKKIEDAAGLVFFENKIRPVLVDKCYRCHSVQSKKLKAGLMLDHRSRMLKGGDSGASIRPGHADESLLIETIFYQNPDLQMPPKSKLADEVIANFKKWIEMGAPWPEELAPTRLAGKGDSAVIEVEGFDIEKRRSGHWSWQPIKRPERPQVSNPAWPENNIDRFIMAKLDEFDLLPATAAEPSRWLRRVYFDLIGLPPSRLQLEKFIDDKKRHEGSTMAEQAVVDQLLESQHYGERWARHWMDLVRFAETAGHEFDYPIANAWRYRDYLIRAFNQDLPYDQFVTEHLAGDLIEPARRDSLSQQNESILATGFWFLNESVHAPTDVLADESDRMDNQIDVFGKTFLGLTLGCARCHDHKFDAISTADYYALCGMMQSSRRQTAFLDPEGKIRATSIKVRQIYQQVGEALKRVVEVKGMPQKQQAALFAGYLLAAQEVLDQSAEAQIDAEALEKVAKTRGLQAGILKNWAMQIQLADSAGKEHPLNPWFEFNGSSKGKLVAARSKWQKAQKSRDGFKSKAVYLLPGNALQWSSTGEAFRAGFSRESAWTGAVPEQGLLQPGGVFNSGRHGKNLEGVLRSPTFELSHNRIHLRLNGKNVMVRLVIDGFYMNRYSQLLFAGTLIKPKKIDSKGRYQWYTLQGDLDKYRGHRVWLEISDEGSGYVSVAKVVLSDEGLPEKNEGVSPSFLQEGQISGQASLAAAYGQYWIDTVAHLHEGDLDEAGANWINFIWQHQLWSFVGEVTVRIEQGSARLQELDAALPKPHYALAMLEGSPEDESIHIRGSHKRLGAVTPRRNLEALGGQLFPKSASGRLQLARHLTSLENPLLSRVLVNRLWYQLFGRGLVATVDDFGDMGQRPSHPKLLDELALDFVSDGWSIKKALRKMVLSKTYRMSAVANPANSAQHLAEIDPENILLHRAPVRRLQGETIRDAMLVVSGSFDAKLGGPSVPVYLTSFMDGRGRPRKSGPLNGGKRRSLYVEIRRNFLPPFMLTFDMPAPFNTMGRRSVSNVPAQALAMMNDPLVSDLAGRWSRVLQATPELNDKQKVAQMFLGAFARVPSEEESSQALAFLKAESDDPAQAWWDLCHVIFNKKEFIYLN